MGWIDSWVHHTPSILKQGRLTHKEGQPLEGEEEVEPEELLAREIKKDPWEPRLKPISKDKQTKGGTPAWVVRSYNVRDTFMNPTTKKATENYGIVVVKSLWWPGATAFFQNGRTFHIYVGDGQKHESETYFPVKPPVMIREVPEKKCWDEPNPTQEWLDYVSAQKKQNEVNADDD